MKFHCTKEIHHFEIDPCLRLKLGAMVRLVMEAAVMHSEKGGVGIRSLREKGVTWVLHKLAITLGRYPRYGEELHVLTWFRGAQGCKAYRDFEIVSGNEKITAVSTVWLYVDLKKKKIVRVPEAVSQRYTIEKASALPDSLDTWKADGAFTPEREETITTRDADFDSNGHVNSAVYVDYLETVIARQPGDAQRITSLKLQFMKEIDKKTDSVRAGLAKVGSRYIFAIRGDAHVYACGDVWLDEGDTKEN